MRLFVYGLGVVVGFVLLSMNSVTTNSVVSEVSASNQPTCSINEINIPTAITGKAWQVVDIDTGEVLAEHEASKALPIASVVKLLTALAVMQESDTSATLIELSYQDIATEGRSGNLAVGENYSSHELIFPLLVTSSNDAGTALARTYPNIISTVEEFLQKAGALNTTIADTTGLSRQNISTVDDLSRILRAIYTNSPHVLNITRAPQIISQQGNGWVNNIPFRSLEGYVGGKQGYLPEANQTGVAIFSVGDEIKSTFGISILSSDSVAKDMEILHSAVLGSYSCTD